MVVGLGLIWHNAFNVVILGLFHIKLYSHDLKTCLLRKVYLSSPCTVGIPTTRHRAATVTG